MRPSPPADGARIRARRHLLSGRDVDDFVTGGDERWTLTFSVRVGIDVAPTQRLRAGRGRLAIACAPCATPAPAQGGAQVATDEKPSHVDLV